MVHTCLHTSTLTGWLHSKLVIAFSHNFWPLYWYKEPLCALRMVIGIPEGRKQPTYSFSWNFYMIAIAEPGPRLWGNLQCATKFTVLVTPHVSQGYAQSSLRTEEWPSLHHLLFAVFYSHWWTVMYQQLSLEPKSLHMVSTFHNYTVRDFWSNARSLSPSPSLSVCVNSECRHRAAVSFSHFLECFGVSVKHLFMTSNDLLSHVLAIMH